MTGTTDPATPAIRRPAAGVVKLLAGMVLVVATLGFGIAIARHGLPARKPWLLGLPVVTLIPGAWLLRSGYRQVAVDGASNYERRYWTSWLNIVVMAMPIGALLYLFNAPSPGGHSHRLFSMEAVAPGAAAGMAGLFVVLTLVSLVLYHRTIDDYEERSYLWASLVGFYFLFLAVPAWWLLQRGGLVPALDVLGTLGLLGASLAVQTVAFLWFKYR